MESIARPLRRLHEEAAWFVRAVELKLLYVRTEAPMRAGVLDLLMGQESSAHNRALFFRFDDPISGADAGWPARVQRLPEQLSEKAAMIEPAGIKLRPLTQLPSASSDGAAQFGQILARMGHVLGAPLTHIVVVIAPVRVDDADRFLAEASVLLTAPALSHVRWIVVETDGVALAPLVTKLGAAALSCHCLVDEKEQQDDIAALGAAGPDDPVIPAAAALTWRAPGAMPEALPPPRPDLPRAPTDEELRAVGLSPKFVKGGGEVLRRLILGGALALRQSRQADAITLQARAAELCAEMEMPREQVINLQVLGGYLIAAGLRDRGRDVYRKSGALAGELGLLDLEAQSELALGMLEGVDRRPAEAAAHYGAAARLAEQAKAEPLAIECWRMAGQLALAAKLETSAVESWKRALRLADPLDPKVTTLTSAPEVARALAALCRRRGLLPQAQTLEQRSIELEHGPPAPAPAAAAGTG